MWQEVCLTSPQLDHHKQVAGIPSSNERATQGGRQVGRLLPTHHRVTPSGSIGGNAWPMPNRARTGSAERPLRVAVVGSGPAGFFTADALLRQTTLVAEVDVFERLPTPYGLVRTGVAPDHARVKTVVAAYEKTAARAAFRFFGNVTLGLDIEVAHLRPYYDQIVYAVGNEADRRLGVEGEGLWGCIPGAVFVGWYNGHPDYRPAPIRLDAERVAIIGHGNVAVDVARILARTPDELATTDIADHALEVLRGSAVRSMSVKPAARIASDICAAV